MMMDSFMQEAFNDVCKQAKESETWYVCLMQRMPYYGGPEEGGWWGSDSSVIAFQSFPSEDLANAAAEQVKKLAADLQSDSQRRYGEQCLRETEWLNERGLEDSYLPEPDGPSDYYVLVNQGVPENSYGSRQYS